MSKTLTENLQVQLGTYCKTGENEPDTSIQEHTYQYRRLITNVFKNSLKSAFPITRHLLLDEEWDEMVDHFIVNHECSTPQVWKMPFEFYEYFSISDYPLTKTHPFLLDLLLFEWMEIEVYSMPDEFIPEFTTNGNKEKDVFIVNPELKVQVLKYPFHKKPIKDITEADEGQYIVTIHRDYYTKKVMFNEVSYAFMEMLFEALDNEMRFDDLVQFLHQFEPDECKRIEAVHIFADFMLKQNLVLGYKPNS